MYIKYEFKYDVLVVYLIGEIDHHSAEEIRIKIDNLIEKNNIKKVLLDFSSVTFMDSSGIGMVLGRYKKLKLIDGILAASSLNKNVKRIFDLSGMFKVIQYYDNVDKALSCM